jgi:hypothetical protein
MGMARYDQSGMGDGSEPGDLLLDSAEEEEEDDIVSEAKHLCARKMKLADFKARLIEHFDILWEKNQIKRPSRTGSEPPLPITERCRRGSVI